MDVLICDKFSHFWIQVIFPATQIQQESNFRKIMHHVFRFLYDVIFLNLRRQSYRLHLRGRFRKNIYIYTDDSVADYYRISKYSVVSDLHHYGKLLH